MGTEEKSKVCFHDVTTMTHRVTRLADTGRGLEWRLDISLECAHCSTVFKFIGDIPMGVSNTQITTDISATELRIPVIPVSISKPSSPHHN